MAKPWALPFYNSRIWRRTRKQKLHDDTYTCHDCGSRANEVHHIVELTPDNINDPNVTLNPSNLMSLCGDCHKKRTKGRADVEDGYCFDEQGNVVRDA
jgi:5-methylcytosine-specific restriction endonuclease McrA